MSTRIPPRALFEFLDDLRRAGYSVGVDDYRAVQDLVLLLTANGSLPDSLVGWKTLLAPLLCTTPAEQCAFGDHFRRWWDRVQPTITIDEARRSQPSEPGAQFEAGSATEAPPSLSRGFDLRRFSAVLASGGGIAAAALLVFILVRPTPAPTPGRGVPVTFNVRDERGQPVRGARVTAPSIAVSSTSDSRGRATLYIPGGVARETQITVSYPGYEPSKLAVLVPPATDLTVVMHGGQIPVVGIAPPVPSRTLLVVGIVAAAIAICAMLWLLLRRAPLPLLLKRRSTLTSPEAIPVRVRGSPGPLFDRVDFASALREMRRHRETSRLDLDADATAHATARAGGMFTPVFQSVPQTPEYLALIERMGFDDQQAQTVADLVSQLAIGGVAIDSFYFRGDPRVCQPSTPASRPVRLSELASKYSSRRLIVFSDGDGMVSPLTGRLEPWVASLREWSDCTIFAVGHSALGRHHSRLDEHGIRLLPLTGEGLSRYGEQLGTGASFFPKALLWPRQLPAVLNEHPFLWSSRLPPDRALRDRLRAELRTYLPWPAYYWLCACAVYPLLNRHLTIYLGRQLTVGNESLYSGDRLLSLSRLPWFREGWMPDWVREDLIASLPTQEEAAVREAIEALLVSALDPAPDGFSLDISSDELRSTRELLRDMMRGRAGSLRDHVFLSVMVSGEHSRLWVKLPGVLRPIFERTGGMFRHSVYLLGYTWTAAALLLDAVLNLKWPVQFTRPSRVGSADSPAYLHHGPPTARTPDLGFRRVRTRSWAIESVVTFFTSSIQRLRGSGKPAENVPARVSRQVHDYSHHEEIWFDFVGGAGGSWNPAYTVFRLLAERRITFAQGPEPIETRRGRLLILAGAGLSVSGGRDPYHNQVAGPLGATHWKRTANEDESDVFALPERSGSSDQLVSFAQTFLQGRSVGAWRTQQANSWFALKLPHGWWLWGVDVGQRAVRSEQFEYFQRVAAEEMDRGSKVILCTAAGAWEPSSNAVRYSTFVGLLRIHGHEPIVELAAQPRAYARYPKEDDSQRIVAGGGGGDLSPTHTLPPKLESAAPRDRAPNSPQQPAAGEELNFFPRRDVSRKLARSFLAFPFKHPFISIAIGAAYWFASLPFIIRYAASPPPGAPPSITPVIAAAVTERQRIALLLLALFLVVLARADRISTKLLLGLAHTGLQYIAMILMARALVALNRSWGIELQPAVVAPEVILFGALVGGAVTGLYLFGVQSLFRKQSGELFAAFKVSGFRSFVRIYIDAYGDLRIYPVGIQRACRRWKFRPYARPDQAWFDPKDSSIQQYASLVEAPILVRHDQRSVSPTATQVEGTGAPTVFISYVRGLGRKQDEVLELAERLRRDGVDARIDVYAAPPEEGWARWTLKQIGQADAVLLVCTKEYSQRYSTQELTDFRVPFDVGYLRNEIEFGVEEDLAKFIAVVLDPDDVRFVPRRLRSRAVFHLDSEAEYEVLLRRLHQLRASGSEPAQV